ncbi:hypothetical protein QC761_511780 [Podospora bellae-mahoneyi]|uniref:Methyltransferase type 12 domain-containing protein n=1 Tax=Podospora bellae-mahoneyi TaxID=2093777 RepID=A0ABR0FEF9_9PEZI|nr:hypothetical protein QC761_511780 [Podospora bellae-mahoneyi]
MTLHENPPPNGRKPPTSTYYNAFTLSYYDIHVLGHNMTRIWRCPTKSVQLPLFQKYFSPSEHTEARCWEHLDVGAGTGFFVAEALKSCLGNRQSMRITLMDNNLSTLKKARRRIEGVNGRLGELATVETVLHDVLDGDIPKSLGERRYDVVTMFNLFHCLRTKAPEGKNGVFGMAARLLRGDGVLVGCTILPGREYQARGLAGVRVRYTLWLYNRVYKVFGNERDTRAQLEEGLKAAFEEVEVEVVGSMMIFVARGPKKLGVEG